jgi:hypothetical protein
LGRTTVQDEATMLRTAGSKAGGSDRAPDAGEDSAEEEDGAAVAEPRRPGRSGQVGVKPRIFMENLNPYTIAIVPGSVAIAYRTSHR